MIQQRAVAECCHFNMSGHRHNLQSSDQTLTTHTHTAFKQVNTVSSFYAYQDLTRRIWEVFGM